MRIWARSFERSPTLGFDQCSADNRKTDEQSKACVDEF